MADGRLAVHPPAGITGAVVAAVLCLLLLASKAAPAQTPLAEAAPAGTRVFCEQTVDIRVAERDEVPSRFQRFLGVWSDAAWDARTCAALIVENVTPDGTASIVYVYGPLDDASPMPGGVLHGTGIVRDGALRFQNSDGTQFVFTPGIVDLDGRLTTPKGTSFSATFKKAP
jgi:hypothetical protein